LVLAGAYLGYTKFMGETTAPEVIVTPQRPAPPSPTLNAIAAAPAKAIQKAEAVVAAVNANVERDDASSVPEESAASSRKAAPKPVEKDVAPVTSTTQLAPGLTVTTTAKVEGDASPAFRSWVAQARVSGVFQGTPARILINGRTVTEGDLVDDALAITFNGIDAAAHTLVFRDRTGATVVRKF
jgi:hypothetical protein